MIQCLFTINNSNVKRTYAKKVYLNCLFGKRSRYHGAYEAEPEKSSFLPE